MNFDADIPFTKHLGIGLEVFDGGEAVLVFSPRPDHVNSFGVTHGGALMTLMDVGMAHAARSVQKDMGAVTIEMKTSFMRPAAAGGQLTCKARLIQRTATMAFTEGQIFDESGQLCAHATGTFKYVKRLPVGPKSVNDLKASDAEGKISTD